MNRSLKGSILVEKKKSRSCTNCLTAGDFETNTSCSCYGPRSFACALINTIQTEGAAPNNAAS